MNPRVTLTAFDRFLVVHGLRFEAVVVGGTALNLLQLRMAGARGRCLV